MKLANAEMYKVVPEILRRFELRMSHDKPWKVYNATFILQEGVTVNAKRREF